MPPLISIVTPVFNGCAKLSATIDSVLAQDRSLFEYFVVDGGSSDGTQALLSKHKPHLRWMSEPDNGIYDAMNKGIGHTTGRFLYFLGAGDTLRPQVLEEIASLLPPPGRAFVYGNVFWEELGRKHDGPFTKIKFSRGCICHQAIFHERTLFDLLGSYDIRYPLAADYIFNIKCFGDKRVQKTYLDVIIANYEGGGISTSEDDPNFYRDAPGVIRKHLGLVPYLFCRTEMLLPKSVKRWRYRSLKQIKTFIQLCQHRFSQLSRRS